jgi:hypothetical protein
MNCFVWNFREAGGKLFPSLISFCLRIYRLHFVAILEQHSDAHAGQVFGRIGLLGVE